jgi:hypothetical protein
VAVGDPRTPAFSRSAQWLWGENEAHPQNAWCYFRRRLAAPATVKRAMLLVTADSRYELSVNGEPLGRGPARGFPFHYYYDLYDVTARLEPGAENVIAVLANHLGDQTFSYICGRPGFICELILEDGQGLETRIVSDGSWRTKRCDAFHQAVPRISLQLEFEEQSTRALSPRAGRSRVTTMAIGTARPSWAFTVPSRGASCTHAPFPF